MTERETIQNAVDQLIAEDLALKTQEEQIRLRRSQLGSAIMSLIALESDKPPEFTGGMAEAIRYVLQSDPTHDFSASDVRTGLKILKFNFDNLTNPLASIHSVLKRLNESGEASVIVDGPEGGSRYRWNDPYSLGNYGKFLGLWSLADLATLGMGRKSNLNAPDSKGGGLPPGPQKRKLSDK